MIVYYHVLVDLFLQERTDTISFLAVRAVAQSPWLTEDPRKYTKRSPGNPDKTDPLEAGAPPRIPIPRVGGGKVPRMSRWLARPPAGPCQACCSAKPDLLVRTSAYGLPGYCIWMIRLSYDVYMRPPTRPSVCDVFSAERLCLPHM